MVKFRIVSSDRSLNLSFNRKNQRNRAQAGAGERENLNGSRCLLPRQVLPVLIGLGSPLALGRTNAQANWNLILT